MTPVVENAAPGTEVVVVSPPLRKERPLVTVDSTRNGRTLYTADEAPVSPVTFKFKTPIANAKIDVKAQTRQRVFANIEALDAQGRVVSTLEGGYDLPALAQSAVTHVERLLMT